MRLQVWFLGDNLFWVASDSVRVDRILFAPFLFEFLISMRVRNGILWKFVVGLFELCSLICLDFTCG